MRVILNEYEKYKEAMEIQAQDAYEVEQMYTELQVKCEDLEGKVLDAQK